MNQQEKLNKDEEDTLRNEKFNNLENHVNLFSVGMTDSPLQKVDKKQLPSSGKPKRVSEISHNRGRTLSRSSSNPVLPNKNIPSDNKKVLDKKKNLTEKRQTSSLKRDREGTSTKFEPGSCKKKVKGEVFSFSLEKDQQSPSLGEGQSKPEEETIHLISDILNEVLSRIKY